MKLVFADAFTRLCSGSAPDAGLVRDAFEAILSGGWTPVQVGAFAAALRTMGETPEVIGAAVRALRAHMTCVDHGLPVVVDTCGTGGDGAQTLNVSTAAAIVVAAAGVPVAKHGNRSVSSRCGSADVVEALGIPLDLDVGQHADLLRTVGIAFLFAPAHHPALRHAAQARQELGVRTIFNALGPIANPAMATHQLIGVYDDALRPILARVLAELGTVRAWVVHGEDGLDEVSPSAATRVSVVEAGQVREMRLTPEDFGLRRLHHSALAGADARKNADSIETIVSGGVHPATEAVVLNAAAALLVAGAASSPREAARAASGAIESGAARRKVAAWREATRGESSRLVT